jgi:hypothetical protein
MFPDLVDNKINNNKHLRSNTKGYGSKTHWTDSQNSDTTAPSGRELYHLQCTLQVVSLETFGNALVLLKASPETEFFTKLHEAFVYIFCTNCIKGTQLGGCVHLSTCFISKIGIVY